MTKTGQQIEDDVYLLLKNSDLASLINGAIYKFGMRPKNSQKEDIVVKFTTGLDGKYQEGSVVINIYVPNLEDSNGIVSRDITRCANLEKAGLQWYILLPQNEYLFSLASTIQTLEETETNQHFVSIQLNYKRITF